MPLSALSSVQQLGVLEINSNNFQMNFGSDQFILKRAGATAQTAVLERQYGVSEILRGREVALPTVYRNSRDSLITESTDRNWILTQFVAGNYYSGQNDELIELGHGIGSMMARLNELPIDELPSNAAIKGTRVFEPAFQRLFKSEGQWPKLFPERDVAFLQESKAKIHSVGKQIIGRLADLEHLPIGVCHIDLHPHNILVRDHNLAAIVDMESFQINRVAISLGFAIFKLARQFAVANDYGFRDKGKIAQAGAAFVSAVLSHCQLSGAEVRHLEIAATFEAYRRLLLITDLNIIKADSVWNRVLPMQLAALTEIPIIFEDI